MTNVLDSPLDALAVNYLSFGFLTIVNNLWTWVALVTAAVSFWRIRASGPSAVCPAETLDDGGSIGSESITDGVPSSESSIERSVVEQKKPVPEQATPMKVLVGGGGSDDDDRVTKGKFTWYYYEDNSSAGCSETTMEKEMEGQVQQSAEDDCGLVYGCELSEWWESWERMLRLRRGDNGWYIYQDLTVVNANVVRLWDGCCTGTDVRDSSSCVVR